MLHWWTILITKIRYICKFTIYIWKCLSPNMEWADRYTPIGCPESDREWAWQSSSQAVGDQYPTALTASHLTDELRNLTT